MKQLFFQNIQISKIKRQILLAFFLAAIVPIWLLGTFAITQVRRQLGEQYQSQLNAEALRVNSILFDITTTAYTLCDTLLSKKDYMYLFASDYSDSTDIVSYNTICDDLITTYQNNAAISSVHIYTDNPSIPSGAYITSCSRNYDGQDWYTLLSQNQWSGWLSLTNIGGMNQAHYELSLIRRIGIVSDEYSAYLVLCLDNNYLKNRIEQTDYQILASIDDAPVFYSSMREMQQKPMPFPEDFNHDFYQYYGALNINGSKVLTDIHTFLPYRTDNHFYICVSSKTAFEEINSVTMTYILILLAASLVPAFLILLYSTHVSRRVVTLKEAMHQARLGNYNIIDDFSGDDELTETFQDLKATMETIREKEARYYEEKLASQELVNRQQQMEFKMLASQINPHFMYNTLQTIQMQALSYGNRDVADSIKLLGKSMRYVLENTGTVSTTLSRELEYVKTYLTIQKLRFGERFNYRFEIPDDLATDHYSILPLLIQPLVENAISHGLEDIDEGGCVIISVFLRDSFLFITVEDNGCGIPPEKLSLLRESLPLSDISDTTSIGLSNIYQRVRLFYGQQSYLHINSTPGKGTLVTLCVPCIPD